MIFFTLTYTTILDIITLSLAATLQQRTMTVTIAEKVEIVLARMAEEVRPAAWLAFIVFVLKADEGGRYKLKSAGPHLLCRLADKLPMYGVWASVSEVLTGQQLTKNKEILASLKEVSVDLKQTQKDLHAIAHSIAGQAIETDAQGRIHLDVIGRILTEIGEAIEADAKVLAAG